MENRQWFNTALKDAYDQYKMFVYNHSEYPVPIVTSPQAFKEVKSLSPKPVSLMNKTCKLSPEILHQDQSEKSMLLKTDNNFIMQKKKLIDNFDGQNEAKVSQRTQIDSNEGIKNQPILYNSNTELIADQILLHKSVQNSQSDKITSKLVELFPKINSEFRNFLKNLITADNIDLLELLSSSEAMQSEVNEHVEEDLMNPQNLISNLNK